MTSKPLTIYEKVNYGGKTIYLSYWGKCKIGSLG
ncbi:unnamed protein product [Arabidopsis halleri]